MVLTKNQKEDLDLAVLLYLKDQGYDQAYDVFKSLAKIDDTNHNQRAHLLEMK